MARSPVRSEEARQPGGPRRIARARNAVLQSDARCDSPLRSEPSDTGRSLRGYEAAIGDRAPGRRALCRRDELSVFRLAPAGEPWPREVPQVDGQAGAA